MLNQMLLMCGSKLRREEKRKKNNKLKKKLVDPLKIFEIKCNYLLNHRNTNYNSKASNNKCNNMYDNKYAKYLLLVLVLVLVLNVTTKPISNDRRTPFLYTRSRTSTRSFITFMSKQFIITGKYNNNNNNNQYSFSTPLNPRLHCH